LTFTLRPGWTEATVTWMLVSQSAFWLLKEIVATIGTKPNAAAAANRVASARILVKRRVLVVVVPGASIGTPLNTTASV